ncbi:hypothetical protein CspeluHIS016_0114030 [Cutaneotrichosporon spelunceum]|uniref:Uncharacterized protein n=1 Tax=Cutaneotrichosporon spelunceum TaxID=1672016 RepID=A0AAD3YAF7_9TREE|nr:hypothetical protein CspeluHIS016_0114030 [Cutaneotrichosporon spelunceum]
MGFDTTAVSSGTSASTPTASNFTLPSAPAAVGASFASCGSFPSPWEVSEAPQAYWPSQVPIRDGRACIGFPNWYMMECCQGGRDYICGWEVCLGTMSDDDIESCFRRLADRDGRRNVDEDEDEADNDNDNDDGNDAPRHGEFVNLARREGKYSFTCARHGADSANSAASTSSRTGLPTSSGSLLAGVTVFAVVAAFATSAMAVL